MSQKHPHWRNFHQAKEVLFSHWRNNVMTWLSVLVTIQSPISAIQYVPPIQSNLAIQGATLAGSTVENWTQYRYSVYSSHPIKTSAVISSNQSTNQSRAISIQSFNSNTIDDNTQQYNHNNSNMLQHFNPYQQSATPLSVEEASNPIFCSSSWQPDVAISNPIPLQK